MQPPLILITNDDGIASPGLAAAAAALDPLGDLLIVAPSSQQTSMGRSRSQRGELDGRLFPARVTANGREWHAVAVNATPAMAVEHALQELAPRPVSLVVSGINYGENVGTCVTVSGTIGAALEAAEHGIPALAVSLEITDTNYDDHNTAVDFRAAAHFTRLFAAMALGTTLPPDVDVLKIEVPAGATLDSDWIVAPQDRFVYYNPLLPRRAALFQDEGHARYTPAKGSYGAAGTDAYALAYGLVAVTPLSLDLTSRVSMSDLKQKLERAPIHLHIKPHAGDKP